MENSDKVLALAAERLSNMIPRSFWLLAGLLPHALAYPKFTEPAAGSTKDATSTLSIKWEDSEDSPSISQLSTYQLFLVGGGNDESKQVISTLVSDGKFSDGNVATSTVNVSLGGLDTNAWFLKMVAGAAQGGTVTAYSDRFTLTEMTSTFTNEIQSAIAELSSDSDVPAAENDITSTELRNDLKERDAAASAFTETGSFAVAYTLQTGQTRYAPMPSIPPTSITAKSASMKYPTSAFTIATTYLSTPYQIFTTTDSQTWTTSSMENTASAAAAPTDTAMRKYLNRWKD